MLKDLKLEIVYKPIDSIVGYVNNTRVHPQSQIDQIKSSIVEFGMCTPIGIHNNTIVYGHGRHEALKQLGYEEVPTLDLSHLTDAQRKAFIIADNKIGDNSTFDEELLKIEIEALQDMDFNIDLLGFSDEELADLEIGLEDLPILDTDKADEVPEVEDNPVIKLGDLIELGHNYQHRLLCGDSTSEENLKMLLNGEKAELVFTDPPYRMEVEGGINQFVGKAAAKLGEAIKHLCEFDPVEFLKRLPESMEKNKMNAYIFCNKDLVPDYLNWGLENGYNFNILFWKKPNAIPLGGNHRPDVEYLLLFRKGATWNNAVEGVSYSKLLEFDRENSTPHPTMKPVGLIENECLISSTKGKRVLDFFLGSGSTMIACENINRKCSGFELDPKYAQVIVQRYVDYTSNPKIKINGQEVDWYEYKDSMVR